MLDIEQFKAELPGLPLDKREEILATLQQSVTEEHRQMAEDEEAEHLAICQKRLAEYDAGGIEAVPFGDVLSHLFGKNRIPRHHSP